MSASGSASARNGASASLAGLDVPRVGHQRHDRELAVELLGHERQGRRPHHVRDRRELLGRGLGLGHEARDRVDRRREQQHAAHHGVEGMESEPETGRHAEVPAAAADRPEQVGFVLGIHAVELAIGGHDLGGQQAVDREALLADEVPHAAAERDPSDPDRTRVAEPDPQAVRVGGVRELERRQAGLRPRRAPLGVDLDRAQIGEIDHDPAVGHALADHAVAAAAHGELEPRLARERDYAGDVHLVGDPNDDRGMEIEPAIEDGARLVVLGVVGSDHPTADIGSQFGDRDAGRCVHAFLLPGYSLSRPRFGAELIGPGTALGPSRAPTSWQLGWGFPIFSTEYACRA